MASSSWPSPTPAAAPTAAFALRPLSLGEILDRIFAIYRRNFWLYASISALSGAVQLISNLINLYIGHIYRGHHTFQQFAYFNLLLTYAALFVFLLASSVTQASTIYAVAELYLGRPTSIGDAIRIGLGKPFRYVGIMLWTIWSGMWLAIVLLVPAAVLMVIVAVAGLRALGGLLVVVAVIGGGIYGVIAYIRNSLAVAASVIETLAVRPSMRRSKVLAADAKGRIFVVYLIYFALTMVVGAIQAPALWGIARNATVEHVGSQILILTTSFLAHTVLTPVLMIGLALIYFDQRVRKEAFDIAFLLGDASEAPIAAVPAYDPAPEASVFGLAPEAPAYASPLSPFGLTPDTPPATAPPSIAAEPYPYNLTPEPSPFSLSTETTPIYPPPATPPQPAIPAEPIPPADDEPLS
jgi:hypothetical protein